MSAQLPQVPNANVQLTNRDGTPTPLFLKLLGQLCEGASASLDARVAAVEASNATLLADITTINSSLGALTAGLASTNTTVAAHTAHLALLPTSRLSGSAAYNPPNLIAGATTTTAVTVTGAALGMAAEASFSLDVAGLVMTAYVSAANTVTVVLVNPTAGAIDLASGTLRAYAWNPA